MKKTTSSSYLGYPPYSWCQLWPYYIIILSCFNWLKSFISFLKIAPNSFQNWKTLQYCKTVANEQNQTWFGNQVTFHRSSPNLICVSKGRSFAQPSVIRRFQNVLSPLYWLVVRFKQSWSNQPEPWEATFHSKSSRISQPHQTRSCSTVGWGGCRDSETRPSPKLSASTRMNCMIHQTALRLDELPLGNVLI